MVITGTLLLLYFRNSGGSQPSVVRSERIGDYLYVRATVAGQTGLFGIDTTRKSCQLRRGWLVKPWTGSGGATVTVGGVDIPHIGFVEAVDGDEMLAETSVDGTLGFDVWEKVALGFDMPSQSIALWPASAIDTPSAKAWAAAEPKWGTQAYACTTWAEPLTRAKDGLPSLRVTTLGGDILVRIEATDATAWMTASDALRLRGEEFRKQAETRLNAQVSVRCISRVSVGGPQPWLVYVTAASRRDPQDAKHSTVSLASISSRRLIFDFPHWKFYCSVMPEPVRASYALSRLLNLPMHLGGGVLRVGPTKELLPAGNADAAELEGDRIVTLCGVKSTELARFLRGVKDRTTLKVVAMLRKIDRGGNTIVDHRGQNVEIR